MFAAGTVLAGRYRVERVLGRGGMGTVVAARHVELGQVVAVKILHDGLVDARNQVARFLREARTVSRLQGPHICRVLDAGHLEDGAPFIAMELLDGFDLGAAVIQGPMAIPRAVDYVVQACIALAEAHAAGIIHRDIKPTNLFVATTGGGPLLKVLDFGIAKAAVAGDPSLTATTTQMGSPGFMSPEQIHSSRDVDARTDVWALGVTLYLLISGRMPFGGVQLAEIAINVETADPLPLDAPPELAAVIMRCLAKDRSARYADAAALANALAPHGLPTTIHRLPVVAPPAPVATPAPVRTSRRKTIVVGGGVAVTTAVAVAVLAITSSNDSAPGEPSSVVVAASGSAERPRGAESPVAVLPPERDPWDPTAQPSSQSAPDPAPTRPQAPRAREPRKPAPITIPPNSVVLLRSLHQARPAMAARAFAQLKPMLPRLSPETQEGMLAPLATMACAAGERATAQQIHDAIARRELQDQLRVACANGGVSLADPH